MLAPDRLPRLPVRGNRPTWPIDAIITDSWAETSTTWGRPEASAVSAAMAASGPTCAHAVGSVQRTGARSGSPVQYMFPVDAITPRSLARHRGAGPVGAEGGDAQPTRRRGRAAGSSDERAGPARRGEHDVGAGEHARRGAGRRGPATSRHALPAFQARKRSDVPSGPSGATARSGSPPGGSTSTTSAPRSARMRPVMAAGSPARSTTRTPASRAVAGAGRSWVRDWDGPRPAPTSPVQEAARSSTCTAQAEPRPMTWVSPTRAPSIWRSPASPRRWVATS